MKQLLIAVAAVLASQTACADESIDTTTPQDQVMIENDMPGNWHIPLTIVHAYFAPAGTHRWGPDVIDRTIGLENKVEFVSTRGIGLGCSDNLKIIFANGMKWIWPVNVCLTDHDAYSLYLHEVRLRVFYSPKVTEVNLVVAKNTRSTGHRLRSKKERVAMLKSLQY